MDARMNHQIIIKKTELLINESTVLIRDICKYSLKNRNNCTIALSGGSTPKIFFPELVKLKDTIQWEQVHFFLVDERFVPFTDKDSNYSMIKEYLFDQVSIPQKNIHPIYTNEDSAEIVSKKYEESLKNHFKLNNNTFPCFDIVMLGLGLDGHTASLFPGTQALNEKKRIAVSVHPKEDMHDRISLTFPVINNARNILFLINGIEKADVAREIIINKNDSLPAARIKPHNGNLYFFLDENEGKLVKKDSQHEKTVHCRC